jgi:peptidoglycan/LPS O-acetylase OafA/YrhL
LDTTRHETLTYLAKNSTMLPGIGAQLELPYAFAGRAVPFNESLWTLPHELQMYILLAVLGAFGALRWPLTVIGLAVIGAAAFTLDLIGASSPLTADRARFVFLFFSGAAMYMLRHYISMKSSLFLACALAWVAAANLTGDHRVHRLVLLATVPYMALWLSFVPRGLIRRFNALGDYSYGTYILAGPVQAFLVTRSASPLVTFGLAMAIVLPMAAISWHLLESRALAIPLPAAAKGRNSRVAVGNV